MYRLLDTYHDSRMYLKMTGGLVGQLLRTSGKHPQWWLESKIVQSISCVPARERKRQVTRRYRKRGVLSHNGAYVLQLNKCSRQYT